MDEPCISYPDYQDNQQKEFEKLCKRCGACCGAFDGDPCEHLMRSEDGTYFCKVYEDRLGLHKTVSGNEFKCVPIRDILYKAWTNSWQCGYKRSMRY